MPPKPVPKTPLQKGASGIKKSFKASPRLNAKPAKGAGVITGALTVYDAQDYFRNRRPAILAEIAKETTDPGIRDRLKQEMTDQERSLGVDSAATVLMFTPAAPVGVALALGNAGTQWLRGSIEIGRAHV